jgi:zinc protease
LKPAKDLFYFTEKPDALQSAIRVGLPVINRNHPDFQSLQVLNTVLGGYFGSRLMANIREDKGYTYGIGSGLGSFKQGGSFFIASEVGADVCKATLTEIEKEINLLKTELVPDGELSLVRNFMLGSLLGDIIVGDIVTGECVVFAAYTLQRLVIAGYIYRSAKHQVLK